MFNSKKLEKFTRYLNKSIPHTISNLTDNLDSKIQKILQNKLDHMNLVTKDELHLQIKNFFKIQKKIEQLEKRFKKMESFYNEKSK